MQTKYHKRPRYTSRNRKPTHSHKRHQQNSVRPDVIGLCGFHGQGFMISRPRQPHDATLLQACQTLHSRVSGFGTNISAGLQQGIDLLKPTPRNRLRRLWLLSDGYPNIDTSSILPLASQAKANYININTIGFGNDFDEALLRRISGATHNGKFISVQTLQQLNDALVQGSKGRTRNHNYRPETTIFSIDLSPSMYERMGDKTKIQVVEEALIHLLNFKQHCFS